MKIKTADEVRSHTPTNIDILDACLPDIEAAIMAAQDRQERRVNWPQWECVGMYSYACKFSHITEAQLQLLGDILREHGYDVEYVPERDVSPDTVHAHLTISW